MLRGGEKLLEEGHEPSRADFSSGPDMPDMPDRPAGNARDLVAGSGLPKICHTPVLETAAGALRWVASGLAPRTLAFQCFPSAPALSCK